MRTLLILALLALWMSAGAQNANLNLTNKDSISLIVSQDIVGFLGKELVSSMGHKDETEAYYIGNYDESDVFNGIIVYNKGKYIVISGSQIVILRKTFASHAEADESLLGGEEYYIAGDRGVYRKP